MRWLGLFVMTACTAPVAIVRSPSAPALAAASPSATIYIVTPHGPPPDAELCGGRGDERARELLDAVMFAACDRFVPAFEAAVLASCEGVAPLAGAVRHIDDARRLDGTYSLDTRLRRNEAFGKAALPLVQGRCEDHFDQPMKRRTWTYPIESVDADWAACAPSPEMVDAVPGIPLDAGSPKWAPAGAWLFAAALADRVGPRGRRHLRKFVTCEAIENIVSRIRDKPEASEWFGPLLISPAVPSAR